MNALLNREEFISNFREQSDVRITAIWNCKQLQNNLFSDRLQNAACCVIQNHFCKEAFAKETGRKLPYNALC